MSQGIDTGPILYLLDGKASIVVGAAGYAPRSPAALTVPPGADCVGYLPPREAGWLSEELDARRR